MASSRARERRVVIAGDGLAACAAAMRWIEAGYRPYLLASPRPAHRALEAVPVAASRLFEACGLDDALAAAGARRLREFVFSRGRRRTTSRADYVLVDRAELARIARLIAVASGARVVTLDSLPKIDVGREGVRLAALGDFLAAIDATGLAAVWSGPRARSGPTLVADVYDATPIRRSRSACDAGEVWMASGFWSYRFATAGQATIGVIAPSGSPMAAPNARIRRRWSIDLETLERTRRRAASASVARRPIADLRASVGDAAMAHNPISGEGIRFALASSIAAVASLRTIIERPDGADVAVDYYRRLVDAEFSGHSRAVARAFGDHVEGRAVRLDPSARLRWKARTVVAGVQRDGFVVPEEVVVADDGASHRWVGAADLLDLRAIVADGAPLVDVVTTLARRGVRRDDALAFVAWSVRRGIVAQARR